MEVRAEVMNTEIVLEQRWLYLEKDDLKEIAKKKGLDRNKNDSKAGIAGRLWSAGVKYSELPNKLLKAMVTVEKLKCGTSTKDVMVNKLRNTVPPPAPGAAAAAATGAAWPAAAPAAGGAAQGPGAAGGAAAAAPRVRMEPRAPAERDAPAEKKWMAQLLKLHEKLVKEGLVLTKERCHVLLQSWGHLPPGTAVYHVISPAAGGVDHPRNYCLLPSSFPSDYHLEGKAELHHMLMLELLPEARVKAALAAGTDAEADVQSARLEELKAAVKPLKEAIKWCGTKRKAPTGAGGGAGQGQAGNQRARSDGNGGAGPAQPADAAAPAPAAGGAPAADEAGPSRPAAATPATRGTGPAAGTSNGGDAAGAPTPFTFEIIGMRP